MLEFGKLDVVQKTFVRKDVSPRGQAYDGIKFRRYDSKSESNPGIKEVFIISDKAFAQMELEKYALAQANFGGDVYLLVVEDQDEKEPVAKFMRQSQKKDGTKLEKGKMFNNIFIKEGLIANGILDATTHENQYLSISNVTNEVAGLPEVVKAVYKLGKDETVDASLDTEDKQETAPKSEF